MKKCKEHSLRMPRMQDIFVQTTDEVGNADTTLAGYSLYAIPEPSTMGMLGLASLGALFVRRRFMMG